MIRLVLASASPARLATLRAAGLRPEVVVSGVDEEALHAPSPAELVVVLASAKAAAVVEGLSTDPAQPTLVLGCDSLLELDGEAYGKPGAAEVAALRWRRLRGRSGVLHTGHSVVLLSGGAQQRLDRVASTVVHFADLDDAEIEAYVATGEPLQVAGAFTLDGLGGAFVSRIEGDPHNVVGISLPLLRVMLAELGIRWSTLWRL